MTIPFSCRDVFDRKRQKKKSKQNNGKRKKDEKKKQKKKEYKNGRELLRTATMQPKARTDEKTGNERVRLWQRPGVSERMPDSRLLFVVSSDTRYMYCRA